MFEIVVPLAFMPISITMICWLWFRVCKFNKNKENRRFLQLIYAGLAEGAIPSQRPKNIEISLREKGAVGHHREALLKNYRSLYRWVVAYRICIIILAVLWIAYVIADIFVYKWSHPDLSVIFLIGAGICIFGLGLPPVFKSVHNAPVQKATILVDKFMHCLFDAEGMFSTTMLEIAYTIIALILNTFIFWGYLKLGAEIFDKFAIESNLMSMLILLFGYRYLLVNQIFSYSVYRLFLTIDKAIKSKDWLQFDFSQNYIKQTLANNTYLVFLLVHIAGKSLNVNASSIVGITIEAIGIVYLFDTYLENWRVVRNKRQKETANAEREP